MRTLFFGTPVIAVPALEALCEISEVAAVLCQPDRPAGRGLTVTAPPVKVRALELGLAVHQPEKIRTRELSSWAETLRTDVALVIAYGRILGPGLLAAPRRGCMNLHASLLPKYRGAAPINWAIVRGETETGISLMQMDEGMDTGPVYTRSVIGIGPDENAGELSERLGALAADVVRRDLARAVAGELEAEPQDDRAASAAPMLDKNDGRVDWSLPAARVHDHARGMTPWPGAHSVLGGRRFKLLTTRLLAPGDAQGAPGEIVAIQEGRAVIACGQGAIALLRGQIEGKKALDAAQLAAGRTIAPGMRFEAATGREP